MEDNTQETPFTARTCAFCLKLASYVCPRCGINYCSLECYRCSSHNQCSEAFYKDCCLTAMHGLRVDDENRKRMLDILERETSTPKEMEDESESSQNSSDEEPSDSAAALSSRFSNIDLQMDIDSDKLWSQLTRKEKRDFHRMLNSGEISTYIPPWTPWWLDAKQSLIADVDEAPRSTIHLPRLEQLFPSGKRPHLSTRFMLADILLGYIYISRFYNGDFGDLQIEAVSNLCEIVSSFSSTERPIPTTTKSDPKDRTTRTMILTPIHRQSSVNFSSFSEVVASIQTRLCGLQLPCSPQVIVFLLEDLTKLVDRAGNICRALEECFLLIKTVRKQVGFTQSATNHNLMLAVRKVNFLRACCNPNDVDAVKYQAAVYPQLCRELNAELCLHLSHSETPRVHRPGAGSNWRHMIRNVCPSTNVHNDKPLISFIPSS